jgi:hypothetical protein
MRNTLTAAADHIRRSSRRCPPAGLVAAAVAALLACAPAAHATYLDLMGYHDLADALGAATPTGNGVEVAQVEVQDGSNRYMPDVTDAELVGKTIVNVTDTNSLPTLHAHNVAINFYGGASSMATGVGYSAAVNVYEANDWLGSGVLRLADFAPRPTDSRVTNHSWIGSIDEQGEYDAELLARLDWLIERDDAIQVVGVPNGFDPERALWKDAYNAISVGRTDGYVHETTLGVGSAYPAGRIAPAVVTPGYSPDNNSYVVSWGVSMASGLAAMLIESGGDASLSNGSYTNSRGLWSITINHAESSEAIKAVMMAGADRYVVGPRDGDSRDDLTNYTVDTTNNLDADYGAGQINAYNSYRILAGVEHDSAEDGDASDVGRFGWDYDPAFGASANNSVATYTFTAPDTVDELSASLVWNAEVVSYTTPTVTERDLDLILTDTTAATEAGRSDSTEHNSEHLRVSLVPGHDYQMQVVVKAGEPSFSWDYALAWHVRRINTWDMDSDGNWHVTANWAEKLPHGMGDVAAFLNTTTAPRTVTLDQDATVATLRFDSGQAYTIDDAGGGEKLLLAAHSGSAAVQVDDQFGAATHTVDATVELLSPVTVDQQSTGSLVFAGDLDNATGQTITVSGVGEWRIAGNQVHGPGAMLVADGGTVTVMTDAGAGGANLSVWVTGGLVELTADQSLAALNLADGEVRFDGVTVAAATTELSGGLLAGAGTVTGHVTNTAGSIAPGASAGLLEIEGDYAQGEDGTLAIELDGGGNDQLEISGAATLAGTLDLSLINGFEPAVGQAFTLLTHASRSGTFDTITGYDIGGGGSLSVHYDVAGTQTTAISTHWAGPTVEGVIDVPGVLTMNGEFVWDDLLVKQGGGDLVVDLSGDFTVGPSAQLAVVAGTVRLEGAASQTLTLSAVSFGDLGESAALEDLGLDLSGQSGWLFALSATAAPEPGTAVLVAIGAALGGRRRRSA